MCGVEADRLEGDDGNDNLVGGVGDDTLEGGMGTDWEWGGWCNDTFLQGIAPNGNDNMSGGWNGGPDVDTVAYAGRTGNVTVSINDSSGAYPGSGRLVKETGCTTSRT